MSVSYFIRYEGEPEDAERFFTHYRTQHAAIMRQYPGIRACKLHHPVPWNDPVNVNKDRVLVLAELVFDDIDALNNALNAEIRMKSREDFLNFPKIIDGKISHLAVETETVF